MGTADSDSKFQPALDDLDAEELFLHFDEVVKVIEEPSPQEN